MKRIAESSGELAWWQSSAWRRDCELREGSDLLATLRWQSAFQAAALAESADGAWKFKLEGFLFRQWVRIEVEGSEESAIFQAQPSLNGILEYGDGRAFYWDSNFWLTKWIWSNEQELECMRVQRSLTLKAEGGVTIDSTFLARPEIPLLTLLGWYVIMLLTDIRPG
ncbi:MAG TPA: hypothetical protein VNA04_15700 [Thermoanaerobaculia bacterium]|nr:hypothetical protein [Thermoanaerobaculia bacterium]